jgi:predicted AAA+ superfamily ATPase
VAANGARFENLVACQLLKYCHFIEDTEGYNMELRYLRDTDKREVDFVVLREKKPIFAVECKTGEKSLIPAISYFNERTDIPLYFQVHTLEKDFIKGNIRLLPFGIFCRELQMV